MRPDALPTTPFTDEPTRLNGVTVKRIRDGYSWDIRVAADGNTLADLRAAAETARQLDAELRHTYLGEKPAA